jgi:Ca2+-transporting ATPase
LIIDPACSVVFEAEPLEKSAMKVPPRRPDQRLFDSAVLVRGLWQGGVLLGVLLVTYAGARWMAPLEVGRDDMARTLTFMVLVLSNLGLIQSNRSWERMAWHGNTASNRQFGWIAAGAVAVLCVVLAVPAVGRLFSFVTPSPALLAAGLGMAVLNVLWFECIKWGLRRVRSIESPSGAVHGPANSCSARR